MNTYPEEYAVAVTVSFVDLNGSAVTPSEVRAKLYNGDDELVNDFGTIAFDTSDTSKEIVIPAAYNLLGEGELQAARVLRVELQTDAGVIRKAYSYLIAGEFRLAIAVNSFQSMEAAELIAGDMPNLSGWNGASEDERYAALIAAYNSITRIALRFKTPIADIDPYAPDRDDLCETIILADSWSETTEEEFLAWPANFRKALRMAQVAEANELIEGDEISRMRRSGIISEKIGESQTTLSAGAVSMNVSSTALSHLAGFVYYHHRIVRG